VTYDISKKATTTTINHQFDGTRATVINSEK